MKKIFITLLSIFLSMSLFAETGFQKHEWFSKIESFPSHGLVDTNDGLYIGELLGIAYQKEMQGASTFVFFGFHYDEDYNELISAGYVLPNKNAKELKNKLKSKRVASYQFNMNDYALPYAEIEREYQNKESVELFYNIFAYCEYITEYTETNGLAKLKDKPGKQAVTIYDYNDDTRCYIFENYQPERSCIVLVPHTEY